MFLAGRPARAAKPGGWLERGKCLPWSMGAGWRTVGLGDGLLEAWEMLSDGLLET